MLSPSLGKNIALTVAYDGRGYLGWQKTKEGPSIEEELQKVLQKIYGREIALTAASRTDAGVHARGQRVNFTLPRETIDKGKLLVSLNSLLPPDIAVVAVDEMAPSFHATLDSAGKEYRYYLCNSCWQYPEYRATSWHVPKPLNLSEMERAIPYFLEEADFSAFTNTKKNEKYESYLRKIDNLSIVQLQNHRLSIHIEGEKFLYKMVRNIVGALVYVGCGKIAPEDIEKILSSKRREKGAVTAPAHGLFLQRVIYRS